MKGSNAVLLYCFAKYCKQQLTGLKLEQAFSTSKEQLFFLFGDFALGVRFHKGFGWLYASEADHLPRKNRLSAFAPLHGKTLKEVIPFIAERAMQFRFEEGILEFRLFGNQSTVIFYSNEGSIQTFPKKELDLIPLAPKDNAEENSAIDFNSWVQGSKFIEGWMLEYFPADSGLRLPQEWFIQLTHWLCSQNLGMEQAGDHPPRLFVSREKPNGNDENRNTWPSLSASFSFRSIRYEEELRKKQSLLSSLRKSEQQILRQLNAIEKELQHIHSRNYKQLGDNLMAWLHMLEKGMEVAVVQDVYTNNTLSIPLKKDLNPQENAARYYRKAKKEHLQQQNREELRNKLQSALEKCRTSIQHLESGEGGSYSSKDSYHSKTSLLPLKYYSFRYEGFEIRVGKNAEGNDLLLREAGKNDFWLHARMYKGAHVIIRCGPQFEQVPMRVKEIAASLAAWNSEARSSALVPVIISQRKYVRKSKGLQKGAVIVDREEVLIVEPKSPEELRLTD